MQKILIIEDEKELADILGSYLRLEGFEPVAAYDGQTGLDLFESEKPTLVLVDIMLPNVDGIQVCKTIRGSSDVPVIVVSAKSGEMDKVLALGLGADDYVTKPFSPFELVARVKAQLRRYEKSSSNMSKADGEIIVDDLVLNKQSYRATYKEHEISFTTKEFEMLFFLAQFRGQVFTKEQIYQNVWGYDGIADDNSVTVYVNRIREKLTAVGMDNIKTIWGVGYKFS